MIIDALFPSTDPFSEMITVVMTVPRVAPKAMNNPLDKSKAPLPTIAITIEVTALLD